MTSEEIIQWIESLENPKGRESLERFKVSSANALGLGTPQIKKIAKQIGKSHSLAEKLWKTGIFEARAIAALIDEPDRVTPAQMDRWTKAFDSWAIVDACCCYLFCRTAHRWEKAVEWADKEPEYVRRAGFSLMAYLAVHDKAASDGDFVKLFPLIEKHSNDERNFVKKAVNWALRQIGKRNTNLNEKAIRLAKKLKESDDRTARWIGSDAYRELVAKRDTGKIKRK